MSDATGGDRAPTIVSVTSLALERDSRTLKMGTSIARLGYRSVVVEGERSRLLPPDLPFELISADREAPPPAAGPQGAPLAEGPGRRTVRGRIREALPRPLVRAIDAIVEPIYTVYGYLRLYWRRNVEVGRVLPTGDAYYLHANVPALAVRRKCRQVGARFLYDAHDPTWDPDPSIERSLGTRIAFRIFEAIERRCIRRARLFTSIGQGVAGLLERRFGRRPEVLRNCHDARLDQPANPGIREVTGVADGDFLLVMTGNAKNGMAVEEALDAVRDLPESVHLAFVGRFYDRHRDAIAARGLDDRVHLLAPVPPTEVVSFIAGADASPILYWALSVKYLNALPNGFFHAIAAGLPLLYPPLVEIHALSEEHGLGVPIDPTDPTSIAAGVRQLEANPALRETLGANVRRAREVLNWEREERALGRLLGDVIPIERGAG